ncbi:MAG: peptidylprolyl isomerase [Burkholderiales bacterium]
MSYQKSLLALAVASLFAVSAFAQSPDTATTKPAEKAATPKTPPKTVSVNGVLIPAARFEFMAKMAASQGQPDSPELQSMVKENLVNQEILVQEAMKKGLDKTPETAMQLEMMRQQILGRAAIGEYVKNNPVKEELLKAEYEKMTAQMGDKEYHAKHILVEKEDEAKAIIAELNKKGDFAKIAKAKSKDAGSAKNGGDLEWQSPSRFVKPFSDAMVVLEKGKYSQTPVKSDFGYHIIKLEDSREAKKPEFNQVKEQLKPRLQQQQIETMITEMRAKAKIEEK